MMHGSQDTVGFRLWPPVAIGLPLLAGCGMRFDEWHPYNFRNSLIGLYAFTRTC